MLKKVWVLYSTDYSRDGAERKILHYKKINMNDTKRLLQARIHDCENKIKRVHNWEYAIRNSEKVSIMLTLIIASCEEKIFNNSLS
jgi:hypothetical protein